MDGRGFDDLTRTLAGDRSRRTVLKGLLGLGGAGIAATVGSRGAEAQWSVLVCLPDGASGYTQRLVPKASVPFYVDRYGAVLPENGNCPVCEPLPVEEACGAQCGGTADRGCGLTATCGMGTCSDGLCWRHNQQETFACYGDISACPSFNLPCSVDSECTSVFGPSVICDEARGRCGECWTDSHCQDGWHCLRGPACGDGNGSGFCGLPV